MISFFFRWKTTISRSVPAPFGRATPLPLRARPAPATPAESGTAGGRSGPEDRVADGTGEGGRDQTPAGHPGGRRSPEGR
ncbi:hypothetical protein [Acetobacter pasteurianus]|uniref:hypothetical protein n=1 Tax=Acetobacter pasteurianus TaxID=438 RepID=UPI003D0BEDD6